MAAELWLAGALVLAVSSLPARAQPIPQPPLTAEAVMPATVALVETWPDVTNYELISPRRASMWTPAFPRVEGYKLPEGATQVYAVQFVRVLVGRDIKVDVSIDTRPRSAVTEWLTSLLRRYETWLTRLSPP